MTQLVQNLVARAAPRRRLRAGRRRPDPDLRGHADDQHRPRRVPDPGGLHHLLAVEQPGHRPAARDPHHHAADLRLIGWLTYKLLVVRRSARLRWPRRCCSPSGWRSCSRPSMGTIWGNNSTVDPARRTATSRSSSAACSCPRRRCTAALVAVLVLAGAVAGATKTWLGRAIRAAAVNPSGAELVGIKIGVGAALVFALGIAAAGAGGAITGILYPFVPGLALPVDRPTAGHRRARRHGQPQRRHPRRADLRRRRDADVGVRVAVVGDRGALRRSCSPCCSSARRACSAPGCARTRWPHEPRPRPRPVRRCAARRRCGSGASLVAGGRRARCWPTRCSTTTPTTRT